MASLLWVAGITLLLVPMATLIDMPIARWFAHEPMPGVIGDALDLSLIYATVWGIASDSDRRDAVGTEMPLACSATGGACPGRKCGFHAGQDVCAEAPTKLTESRFGEQRLCLDLVVRLDAHACRGFRRQARELFRVLTWRQRRR